MLTVKLLVILKMLAKNVVNIKMMVFMLLLLILLVVVMMEFIVLVK